MHTLKASENSEIQCEFQVSFHCRIQFNSKINIEGEIFADFLFDKHFFIICIYFICTIFFICGKKILFVLLIRTYSTISF